MKAPLFLSLLLIASSIQAQEYCTYNSQMVVNFGANSIDTPFETIELEDGKYIIIGNSSVLSQQALFASICKMNADDSIDATFGENGRVSHTWDGRNSAVSAALQSDGKILLGGNQSPGTSSPDIIPYVGRLNTDGSKDDTFGINGSALFDLQEGIRGTTVGVKELPDGKILAAIITAIPKGIALVRLNADGSYDDSFNANGSILHEDNRIIWQTDYGTALFKEDGSVVIASKSIIGSNIVSLVYHLNDDGSLNSNFGTNGSLEITTPIQGNSAGIHAAFDGDENILIGTTSANVPKKYQIAKVIGETGVLDADFGQDGIAFSTNTDGFNTIGDLKADPSNGDIYAVGTGSTSSWDNNIWRLNSNGQELSICGDDAMYLFPIDFVDGLHTIDFFSDGIVKLTGEGLIGDESSPGDDPQSSNFSILNFQSPMSINEIGDSELLLYPNPANNSFNIQVNNHKIEQVVLRNHVGQIVLASAKTANSIDIDELSPGLYLVEIKSSKGMAIRKLVKQ